MKRTLILIVLLTAAISAFASDDSDAYCKYVTEQAAAQRDLDRTPNAVVGPIQPSTGTPPQLVFGLQNKLADQRRARVTMQVAKTSCDLYRTSTEAQRRLFYALPSIEKLVLKNRLDLISSTESQLTDLMTQQAKLVDAQNMTRPALYALEAAKVRLDQNRAIALSGITSPYVPPLSTTPLRELIGEKITADAANAAATAKLQKLNDWDLSVEGGVHHQLQNPTNTLAPYAMATLTYNLGSHAADKHTARSVEAYSEWKSAQENDVVVQAKILQDQLVETIKLNEDQLKTLETQDKDIAANLTSLGDLDTDSAMAFRNQLTGDKLILQVDIKDLQYRLTLLRQYLVDNF